MTQIFAGDNKGNLVVFDSLGSAKVGRWCGPDEIPDRCYKCWDKETLRHYEAEGYKQETEDDGTTWRYGVCHRCHPELCQVQ